MAIALCWTNKTLCNALGDLICDWRSFAELQRRTGVHLTDSADLREMDAIDLKVSTRGIDLVPSNATWEHLADVPRRER
jgi:hypothetical protein